MKARLLTAIAACMALGVLSGCTTRYQDLLRDRDAQIREYNARMAQLRAEHDDLVQKEQTARRRAEELQRQLDGMIATPVATLRGSMPKSSARRTTDLGDTAKRIGR